MFGILTKRTIAKRRETFHRFIDPLVEEGLVTIIYETESLAFLNICDAFYSAHAFTTDGENQVGFLVNSEVIKNSVADKYYFPRFVKSLPDDNRNQRFWAIGPSTVRALREAKASTDVDGPTADVDVEMEIAMGVRKRK